tara:strand:+ start:2452 stop:2859 length:408 start_codon:yes stop_codon:yes gene_type:complete
MRVHEEVVWAVMVVLREVVNRHVAYVLACACVAALGEMPFLCTALLSAITCGLRWHTQNAVIFYVLSAFLFAAVEVVTMAVAVKPWHYDYPMSAFGIPLWVLPFWSVRAQWSMDVFCVAGVLVKYRSDKCVHSAV